MSPRGLAQASKLTIAVALAVVVATWGHGAAAQSGSTLSPAMQGALDRFKTEAAAEDRAADVAKSGGRWSGSTDKLPDGSLHVGQDLTNPVRSALANACHEVAHAPVNPAYVRVDRGHPHPLVTCKLKSGRLVTIKFGPDNVPQLAR